MTVNKSTMEDNLRVWQNLLRTIYGNDFVINPEGAIDNIAVATSALKMDFEDQLLYLKKNLNPYTAGGVYQDGLYYQRNLTRRQSTYTKVRRTIEGTPNAVISAGSLLIENAGTKDQFQLADDVTLGANGKGNGTFQSLLIGAIDLPNDANINILTPLPTVSGVYYSDGNDINIGLEYENDEEFRKRFLSIQEKYDRLEIALLALVDNPGDLRVIQNRGRQTYPEIPLRTKQITIYSAESNQTIAQAIFDNMVDAGFDLDGDIVVEILDSEGQPVEIRFNRAPTINVYLKTTVKKVSGFIDTEVQREVVAAIQEYLSTHNFNMGEPVVGNRFNTLIDNQPSVDYVIETLLSSDNVTWVPVLEIESNQIPLLTTARTEVVIE